MSRSQQPWRRNREAPPPPPKSISTLQVPDALLEWGRDPARVVTWSRDWAQEVAALAAASEDAPLTESVTQRLLARLEALVAEAVAAGRADLLVGLDMQTAEWLGLQYGVTVGDRRVALGKGGDFDWSETRVLTEAHQRAVETKQLQSSPEDPDPAALASVALRAMDLVHEVFPGAKLSAAGPTGTFACVACGDTSGSVRVETDFESEYCRACWSKKTQLAVRAPVVTRRGRS
jgi:hypothetical protein